MKKYITVILFCTLVGLMVVPGVYSAWNDVLKIEGQFTIKAKPDCGLSTDGATADGATAEGDLLPEAISASPERLPAAPGPIESSVSGGEIRETANEGQETVENGEIVGSEETQSDGLQGADNDKQSENTFTQESTGGTTVMETGGDSGESSGGEVNESASNAQSDDE